jgi:DNA polymerase-3 subunit delta'
LTGRSSHNSNNWVHAHLQPDLTLLFDLPAAIAGRRIAAQARDRDRFEQEQTRFSRASAPGLSRAGSGGTSANCTSSTPTRPRQGRSRNWFNKRLQATLFMKIIELHDSTVWRQLQRCGGNSCPHALLMFGSAGDRQVRPGAFLRRTSLLCEAGEIPARPAASAWPAAGWRRATTRTFACCSRRRSPAVEAIAGGAEGEELPAAKKPSQQITIDQVRALDDFLHVGTHRHGARLVLLNPAEAMNRATANALLKSLEEPIASTLFILVSSEPAPLAADDPQPLPGQRCPFAGRRSTFAVQVAARRRRGARPTNWLALAGGSPLLALELTAAASASCSMRLLAQVSRGQGFDPLAAAADLDKVVKADKRPAPLKRDCSIGRRSGCST